MVRIAVFVVVAWALACTALLALAWRDLDEGVDRLERSREEIDLDDLTSTAAADALRDARAPFARAEARVGSPLLLPLRFAPVVGRQLRSVRALSGAATDLTGAGATIATEIRTALSDLPAPDRRVEAVGAMEASMRDALATLRAVDLGPREALFSSLADRRDRMGREIAETTASLEDGIALASATGDLLGGPSRYLLLAANNAEMRAGSGMFLQAGTLEMAGGRITLGPMRPTHELTLDEPVPVSGDLAERWGFTELGAEWRNLASSPRFPATAEVASRMWREATGETVDGVVAIDVAAIAELVEATGAVEAGGTVVDGENAEDFLLHDQYDLVVEGGVSERNSQRDRRDLLGDLAEALVEKIEGGDVDTGALAAALRSSIRGRHVLMWSPVADIQSAWAGAGLSGELRDRSLLLSVLNRGGNKLDPFTRVDATIERSGEEVTVRVAIDNRTPGDEVPYVAGPGEGLDVAPGTYVGFLSLNVPGDATGLRVEGGPLIVAGADGPTRVAATQFVLPRRESIQIAFHFTLPGPAEVRVEPSARLPAIRWHLGSRTFTDRRPVTVRV